MNVRNLIIQVAQSIDIAQFNEYPQYVNGVPNGVVVADTLVIEQLCPINAVTGFRDSDFVRLFSDDVSKQEKDFILSNLVIHFGKANPKDLTDEEMLALIPSRYASDPVELAKYQKLIDELVKDYEDRNKLVEPVEPADPAPTEPTSTNPHP